MYVTEKNKFTRTHTHTHTHKHTKVTCKLVSDSLFDVAVLPSSPSSIFTPPSCIESCEYSNALILPTYIATVLHDDPYQPYWVKGRHTGVLGYQPTVRAVVSSNSSSWLSPSAWTSCMVPQPSSPSFERVSLTTEEDSASSLERREPTRWKGYFIKMALSLSERWPKLSRMFLALWINTRVTVE